MPSQFVLRRSHRIGLGHNPRRPRRRWRRRRVLHCRRRQLLAASQEKCCRDAAERELAELLVQSLNLDGVAPEGIDPEAPLFGAGLGLDSIDALELSLAISKQYGFQLRSDNDDNRRIFGSLRALSAHVEQHKTV